MTTVREARPDDVPAIRDVHVASIRGLASSHYDAEQIDAWSDREATDYSIPAEGAHVVVAEAGGDSVGGRSEDEPPAAGEVVGFGAVDLEAGEVRAVYVHPDHADVGVGSALLEDLERAAAAADLTELHLTASLNAVTFYEHHGWRSSGSTTHELADGTTLEARSMRKTLAES